MISTQELIDELPAGFRIDFYGPDKAGSRMWLSGPGVTMMVPEPDGDFDFARMVARAVRLAKAIAQAMEQAHEH